MLSCQVQVLSLNYSRLAMISREKQNIKTEAAVEKLQLFYQNSDYEVYHNCRIKRDIKLFRPTDTEVLSLEEKQRF